MIAGTDFPTSGLVSSSNIKVDRLSMLLLKQADVETTILCMNYGSFLLSHEAVRRCVMRIGGIPRTTIEFIERLVTKLGKNDAVPGALPTSVVYETFDDIVESTMLVKSN